MKAAEGVNALIHAPPLSPSQGPLLPGLLVGAWGAAVPNWMIDAHHIQRVSCNSSISKFLARQHNFWERAGSPTGSMLCYDGSR
jgi:hypothetical protein